MWTLKEDFKIHLLSALIFLIIVILTKTLIWYADFTEEIGYR